MEFVNKLRDIKEQSKETARQALERVRESGASLERHLRQKMRIYPRSAKARTEGPELKRPTPSVFEEELEETERIESQGRKPIVSIRGKDTEPAEADSERRGAKNDRRIA
jgi:hypothetical protein